MHWSFVCRLEHICPSPALSATLAGAKLGAEVASCSSLLSPPPPSLPRCSSSPLSSASHFLLARDLRLSVFSSYPSVSRTGGIPATSLGTSSRFLVGGPCLVGLLLNSSARPSFFGSFKSFSPRAIHLWVLIYSDSPPPQRSALDCSEGARVGENCTVGQESAAYRRFVK